MTAMMASHWQDNVTLCPECGRDNYGHSSRCARKALARPTVPAPGRYAPPAERAAYYSGLHAYPTLASAERQARYYGINKRIPGYVVVVGAVRTDGQFPLTWEATS